MLRLVEAMNLINEENGAAAEFTFVPRLGNCFAQVLHAPEKTAERPMKRALAVVASSRASVVFLCPERPRELVRAACRRFQSSAAGCDLTHQVTLAHELVERSRSHPFGEGRRDQIRDLPRRAEPYLQKGFCCWGSYENSRPRTYCQRNPYS